MNEAERIARLAGWYAQEQLDFDKRLVGFRYRTLEPHLRGPRGLELGPADGQMTRFLLKHFDTLTVVEGSPELLKGIPDAPNLVKVHALFEEFEPDRRFDTVIMEHILEHVEQPTPLLRRAREWVAPDGRILVGVPNGHSIHRLVAVKMGLLKHPCQLNDRDVALGHRRVYTPGTLREDLQTAGLEILEMGGVFLKPVSNQQIQDHWTEAMVNAFYELGNDFPEHAAELYAVCRVR